MAPAPHVVYSDELSAAFKRGHPIANPQPVMYETVNSNGEIVQSGLKPIEIGDVGYIQPEHGFFIRLFNVHLEPGVDGQPEIDDLPHGFQVLPKDTITKTQDSTPVFVSHSVKTKNINAAASGPFFGGFAEFSASSKRGAILATPDPIESHNAIHVTSYKTHAQKNLESWHEFALRRQHAIALEQLILVTGVDLTTSWATAVFSETKLEAGFGLKVQFADMGEGLQFACQFSWQSTFGAHVNSGPAKLSRPSAKPARPSIEEHGAASRHDHPEPVPDGVVSNQTIFIRHLRAKPRRPWRGLALRAAGEKDDSDSDTDDSDDESRDGHVGGEGMGPTSSGGIAVASHPKRRKFHDCLEPVLDYILEHTDSSIAIAHDDDLNHLTQSINHSQMVVEDGVGMILKEQSRALVSASSDTAMLDSPFNPKQESAASKIPTSAPAHGISKMPWPKRDKGRYHFVDFDFLRVLGTGSLSRVHLVRSKHNQRFYAVKVLNKNKIVAHKQIDHTNNEMNVLLTVQHPFIVNLWGTFQDATNLFMVMDFVPGGELFSLLRRTNRFPEPVAKFYAAEVALALNHLHTLDIVHRDLKPENILLARDGHIKLVDFGFAKYVPTVTWTLCGTPDYLAPEVVDQRRYNKSVDWYAMGILIFEMLTGFPPFYRTDPGENTPMALYGRIQEGERAIRWPTFPPLARDIVLRFLEQDPSKRIGNLHNGAGDVFEHAWFREVNWTRLRAREITAPFVPEVASPGDARAFQMYAEDGATAKYGEPAPDPHGSLFPDFDYTAPDVPTRRATKLF